MLLITEKLKYYTTFPKAMTSIAEHKNNFKQFLEDINEKIRANLLLDRQKLIAFAASEAATNVLEYYLHRKDLISSGMTLNHNHFSSERRASRTLEFDFPHKNEILNLMIKQEELRDLLCYGKEKQICKVQEAIANVQQLKKIIEEELGEEL